MAVSVLKFFRRLLYGLGFDVTFAFCEMMSMSRFLQASDFLLLHLFSARSLAKIDFFTRLDSGVAWSTFVTGVFTF